MIEHAVTRPASAIAILGAGLDNALGTSLPAVSAAHRAGLSAYREQDWLPSGVDGRPLLCATHGLLPPGAAIDERMLSLARRPLAEALHPVRERLQTSGARVGVFLALPPYRPGWDEGRKLALLKTWFTSLPFPFLRDHSGILETGHHGAISLLRQACAALESGAVELCLVGGIDSWIDIELLDWLDRQGRLKGEESPQGLVPGEGAAFLVLGTTGTAQRLGAPILGRLLAVGEAVDPTPWHLGGAIRGDGLATLLRELLHPELPIAEMTLADLNGESWRVDEWIIAYLRSAARHGEPLDLRHPADGWGDLGAASGAALVALAIHELRRDPYGPGTALVWTASDARPFRSACLVARAQE